METKVTLKVVRTGIKRVFIYSVVETKVTLKVVRTGIKRVLYTRWWKQR